jgi:hypothetical protein
LPPNRKETMHNGDAKPAAIAVSGARRALRFTSIFVGLLTAMAMVVAASPAHAARENPLVLNFVNSFAPQYSNDEIWLMWAQAPDPNTNPDNTFTATYGNGNVITLDHFDGKQSTPVRLSDFDNASLGMNITYMNSATLYVGFSKTGHNPFDLNAAPSPNTATYKFMQLEVTATGEQADQADLTAINYFSFPMSLTTHAANGSTLQYSGFGTRTADEIITKLQQTYTGTGPEITDGSGNLVRILGPNSAYTLSPHSNTGGYSTFQNYLAMLYDQQEGVITPSSTLQLAYGGNTGYTADVEITQTGDGYGIIIKNVVTGIDIGSPTSVSGEITISPDTSTASPTSVTIYSGVLHAGDGSITGDLADPINGGLVSSLIASLSASLVTGAAGSSTLFPGSSDEYRALNSLAWFDQNSPLATTDPGLFFSELQLEKFYDQYFAVIAEESDFTVYGSPFADRFSEWTVALQTTAFGPGDVPFSQWTPVTSMTLYIGPIPEPSTLLLLAGAGAVMAMRRRRRV